MSDADVAYRIAEERIERARAENLPFLCLSPKGAKDLGVEWDDDDGLRALVDLPPEISELSDLRRLDLDGTQVVDISPLAHMEALQTLLLTGTQVADISPLARMEALQTLNLGGTQVADIAPLARMEALRTLYLHGTQVADIAPLARMEALRRLTLHGTQVADISPLARMEALQTLYLSRTPADLTALTRSGAAWETDDRNLSDLEFRDTPLTAPGGPLSSRYDEDLSYEERTARALSILRELRDGKPRPSPQPPEQRPDELRFDAGPDGPIRLIDERLDAGDADQQALQLDLRRRAEELAAALAGSNEFGELAAEAHAYAELLARPAEEIGAKRVWSLANHFRRALAAQQAAERDGRLNDLLPPIGLAALEGVVVTGGPWLLDHPGVEEVERAARAYQALPGDAAEAEAARPVIEPLVERPDIIEPESLAPALDDLREFGEGGPIGDMAQKGVLDYVRGYVGYLLRGIRSGLRWANGAFLWIGGSTASATVIAKALVFGETAIRAYLVQSLPSALPYFEKVIEAIRFLGF